MKIGGTLVLSFNGNSVMRSRVFFSILFLASSAALAHFCPFCDAPTLTLAEQLDTTEHLLLVSWKGGVAATDESMGHSRFKVLEVGKSEGDLFEVGEELVLPRYYPLKEDLSLIHI